MEARRRESVAQQSRQIEALAVLADPVRRSLYEFVVSSEPKDVSRDQSAETLGIRRGLAAFHLDKLVEAGLLETQFRRPPGLGGPGAGRPTKFYRRSRRQIDVTLPRRRYDLMGKFLADALAQPGAGRRRTRTAARAFGRQLAKIALDKAGERASSGRKITEAMAVLAEHGFEPARLDRDEIILRNCPFHVLAVDYKQIVCRLNLELHEGLAETLGVASLKVERRDRPDLCCATYKIEH